MIQKKVKVFDSSLSSRDNAEDLDNTIVNSKGKVKGFSVDDSECREVNIFELEDNERVTLQMFKSSVTQARDLLDSALRKQQRFESILMSKVFSGSVRSDKKCKLSPLGNCWFIEDTCVFCKKKM
jgi:hypothetical protein